MQKGNDISHAKVTRCSLRPDRTVTGRYDNNPMLNSIVYEVEFPDSEIKGYATNTIEENMITQLDSDGLSTTIMDGIVDYRTDSSIAVPKSDMYVVTKRGKNGCASPLSDGNYL